jgi:hypothetical protein
MAVLKLSFTAIAGLFFSVISFGQSVGINTGASIDANAMLEVRSTNKGILIPRIDYNNRPQAGVVSGTMIFVTANGPAGNNSFYYYNGSAWVKSANTTEKQQLSKVNDTLYINPPGNHVYLGDVFPVSGYIKCGGVYINPFTDNNNCGACGNVCASGTTCRNGTCQ